MAANTGISWTDHTFNGWWGCTRVGPGCDHCYAADLDKRAGGDHWGTGVARRLTSDRNWNEPIRWNRIAEARGVPFKVFASSMCDVFDNEVPQAWRDRLWEKIDETPHLRWQILTKRIGNAAKMLPPRWTHGFFPENVGLMATVVNQDEADRDIPKLLHAADEWAPLWIGLSIEPMLGPVILPDEFLASGEQTERWVICGGESGPNARPMHPEWARSLRDQCVEAGTPFLFKQWGEWAPGETAPAAPTKTERVAWWLNDRWRFDTLSPRQSAEMHVDDEPDLYWIGNKAAGNLLDGRTWEEFPEALKS